MKYPFILIVRGIIIAVLITIFLLVISVLTQAQGMMKRQKNVSDPPDAPALQTANNKPLSAGEIMWVY